MRLTPFVLLWITTLIIVLGDNDLWDFNLIEILFLIFAIMAGLYKGVRFLHKRYGRPEPFDLRYLDSYPPRSEHSRSCSKELVLGNPFDQLVLEVIVKRPLRIERFDFRFVQTDIGGELPKPEPITISDVHEPIPNGMHGLPKDWSKFNGIYIEFDRPKPRKTGESMYFMLDVNAEYPWEGYLSFRSYDQNEHECFSRRKFKIVEPQSTSS